MANYYKDKHPVIEVDDEKMLTGSSSFCENAFGAILDTGTNIHNHAIEFATSKVVSFKDPYLLSWMSNVGPPKLCKLCGSTGEDHILQLCYNPETNKLMEIHDSLMHFDEKKVKWELLDKKSLSLETIKRKLPAGNPLITKIARFIAVLRWARIVFCVKPELERYGNANQRDACRLYEEALFYLSKVTMIEHSVVEESVVVERMKTAANFLSMLLVRLLAGLAYLRLPQPVDEDQRNMNVMVMAESSYWREVARGR